MHRIPYDRHHPRSARAAPIRQRLFFAVMGFSLLGAAAACSSDGLPAGGNPVDRSRGEFGQLKPPVPESCAVDAVFPSERSCGTDEGACVSGRQRCIAGEWGACEGATEAISEVCDGIVDDDCDGIVDNGCGCDEGETLPCGTDEGICEKGLQRCINNHWGPCENHTGPREEVCDGVLDEDCNGLVDDNCKACTDGEEEPCGRAEGACERGIRTCTDGVWGRCEGEIEATLENCEGRVDEDCDGTVDNGCPCTSSATRPCGEAAECQAAGEQTCVEGLWGPCIASESFTDATKPSDLEVTGEFCAGEAEISFSWSGAADDFELSGEITEAGDSGLSRTLKPGTYSWAVIRRQKNLCDEQRVSGPTFTLHNPLGQLGAIIGERGRCAGIIEHYAVPSLTGVRSYTWAPPPGSTVESGQGSNTVSVRMGGQGGQLCVTAQGACTQTSQTCIPIAPRAPDTRTPGAITGSDWVKAGQAGVSYSVPGMSGATGYEWTVPPGATIISGATTNAIEVTFGHAGGAVAVAARGECGLGGKASMDVHVATPESECAAANGELIGQTCWTPGGSCKQGFRPNGRKSILGKTCEGEILACPSSKKIRCGSSCTIGRSIRGETGATTCSFYQGREKRAAGSCDCEKEERTCSVRVVEVGCDWVDP